jgi:hypothetical protein
MLQRLAEIARIAAPIIVLAAIALAGQAAQRWR